MAYETLTYEKRGRACWITLNRPDALNAISQQVMDDLSAALDAAEADEEVWAAVLTGAGRAFCAGADLKDVLGILTGDDAEAIRAFMNNAYRMFRRVAQFEKPLIAAVNGIAAAGGLELILGCDLVIAAESAKIGDAHANYGLVPGGGSSIRLPRKIGPTRARQLLYTGEFLPAQTLMDWGLVNEVVPDGELTNAVDAMLEKMLAKSPVVLRRMKRLVDDGLDAPLDPALRLEMMAWEAHSKSEDLKEGLNAFSEKRTPAYSGR